MEVSKDDILARIPGLAYARAKGEAHTADALEAAQARIAELEALAEATEECPYLSHDGKEVFCQRAEKAEQEVARLRAVLAKVEKWVVNDLLPRANRIAAILAAARPAEGAEVKETPNGTLVNDVRQGGEWEAT